MKALLSKTVGGPETLVLEEVRDPIAGPDQLLVSVKACSVNYPDVLIIEDKYQMKPPRPFAPGAEIAGIIDAIGENVTGWKVGDRVIATTGFGGMVEKIAIPAASAFPMPADCSFADGAALLLTYATTIHALVDRGQLKEGETLLVLGAAGGVGMAAVELGKSFGARVVAGVSNTEKASAVRAAGADDVVIYGAAPQTREESRALADAFKTALGPGGANVIYDPVGGAYCEPALRAIAWEGRYLVIGFPAGIPNLPLNLTLLKSCDVRGVFWGAFAARDPQANKAHVARLFRLLETKQISPNVTTTYPLERGADAIAHMVARKAIGKIVVTMGD